MKKRPDEGDRVAVWDDLWDVERHGTVQSVLGAQFMYTEDGDDFPRYVFYTDNNWKVDYESKER